MLIDPSETRLLWLLVRTKPKQERCVADALMAREIAAYLPRVVEPRWHRRAPRGPVPLFPSYVFAQCVVRDSFNTLKYCPGALGLVRFGDHVAALEESIIAGLKEREGERGFVEIKAVRRVPQPGMRARIEGGPLAGLEGVVTRYLPAHDRVRLLLFLVSGKRNVEVEARNVRCA